MLQMEYRQTSGGLQSVTKTDKQLYQPIEMEIGETSASTLVAESWQARKTHHEFVVETAKLDTLLFDKYFNGPVTIKIDVEDHEAAVLRGAATTIRKFKSLIVL